MQKNVLEYLENSVKNFPNKIAFADENSAFTYAEFSNIAKKLAMKLSLEINEINKPIVVFVDRNVESLIAFMGVLYSGNFYVPIDNKMPRERIKKVLEQVDPRAIIYQNSDEIIIQELMHESEENTLCNDTNKICKVNISSIIAEKNIEIDEIYLQVKRKKILDVDPVYVIFTSGSTGIPKGIVISHRSVIDFTDWMAETFRFSDKDIMGNQAPFYFDLSVKDIYTTLKCAATTYIIPKKTLMFPTLLIDFLNDKKVTSLIWATSAFNLVSTSKVLQTKTLDTVDKVILGGEALLAKHLNAWKQAMPNIMYVNLYGPTEVTVDCTYYIIDRNFADDEAVPIGKACENKEVLLLNEELKEVADGEPGEICVRGTGLAKGYFNDKDKTNEVFIQNPLNNYYPDIIYKTGDIGIRNKDGLIVFQARKDGQIKHMGYRIELGEIERALNSFEKINAAVCFYDETARKIICVYEGEADASEIIKHIQNIVPKYMYPNILKKYEKMPYNANGKIDRVKLKKEYFESI